MNRLLGKNGLMLWLFANGRDTSEVSGFGSKGIVKTIGNSTTAPRDLVSDEDIKIPLYVLSESVAERLRACDFLCRGALSQRCADFIHVKRNFHKLRPISFRLLLNSLSGAGGKIRGVF